MTARTELSLPVSLLQTSDKITRILYSIVLAVWSFYLYLLITGPTAEATSRYQISDVTLFFLRLTIALPYLIMWLLTANAFAKVFRYATAISDSREERPFKLIAYGICAFLPGLIIPAFVSSVRNNIGQQQPLYVPLTIIMDYAYVVPILIAFGLFLAGGRELSRRMSDSSAWRTYTLFAVLLSVFAYVWLELIFTNPARSVAQGDTPATYYLPDSLIILTIVVPWFITWILGVMSIVNLNKYRKKVKGILYRQSLSSLVIGLTAITLNTIFLQGLQSIGNNRLSSLGLGAILVIVYVYILLQAVGFLFISRGANQLIRLESV